MFKSNLIKIVCLALFCFIVVPLFAYDGTAYGGYDGNFSRYRFIQQASNAELAREVVRKFGSVISKFFMITEDSVDEEDVEFINNQQSFILRNFRVTNGDAFSYVVKRSDLNNGAWDGWIVFSHYSTSQGWLHYLYYFSIS